MAGPLSTLFLGDADVGGGVFRKTAKVNPNYNPSDPASSPYLDDTLTGRQGNAKFAQQAAEVKLRALQHMELQKLMGSQNLEDIGARNKAAVNLIGVTGSDQRTTMGEEQRLQMDALRAKAMMAEAANQAERKRLGTADRNSADPIVRGMAIQNSALLNADKIAAANEPYNNINAQTAALGGIIGNGRNQALTNAAQYVNVGPSGSIRLGEDGDPIGSVTPGGTKTVTEPGPDRIVKVGNKEVPMPGENITTIGQGSPFFVPRFLSPKAQRDVQDGLKLNIAPSAPQAPNDKSPTRSAMEQPVNPYKDLLDAISVGANQMGGGTSMPKQVIRQLPTQPSSMLTLDKLKRDLALKRFMEQNPPKQ